MIVRHPDGIDESFQSNNDSWRKEMLGKGKDPNPEPKPLSGMRQPISCIKQDEGMEIGLNAIVIDLEFSRNVSMAVVR